jgi:hypothetical protein
VPRKLLEALAAEANIPKLESTKASTSLPKRRLPKETVLQRARAYLAKMSPAVSGEGGHNQTFAAACALVVGFGLSVEAARPLLEEYNERCEPPWSEKELEHKLADAAKKAEEDSDRVCYLLREGRAKDEKEERLSPTDRLLALVDAAGVELFHTPGEKAPYALVAEEGRHATMAIEPTGQFADWLIYRYLLACEGKAPSSQSLNDAVNTLQAKARLFGPEHPVSTRVAKYDQAIYLDLGDDAWHAVRITAAGWDVVEKPPVRFRHPAGMLPLPTPVRGGRLRELYHFLNLNTKEDRKLVVGWLLGTLWANGPFPVLVLTGEQGCAKTCAARLLRSLVDPNFSPVRDLSRTGEDLMITATNQWVPVFDNLSNLPPWTSDGLCRLSTGGGYATRTLFTNKGESLFDCKRPVILVGIDELATRGDLLDRCVIVTLPVIPDDRRRPEDDVLAEFAEAQPRILGALLDVAAGALRCLPEVPKRDLPRMADFARWVCAAEGSLGWRPGSFLEAYRANIKTANAIALDDSPFVPFLRTLVEQKDWPEDMEETRTPTALFGELTRLAGGRVETHRIKGWPQRTDAAVKEASPCVAAVWHWL